MSTADSFPVTSNVPYNAGTFPSSVTVINQDLNNTVYLSDAPTTQQGFPLDPGATITWPANKVLYLYIFDTTKPVNVLISDVAGLYTSPKAIASQILQGGLANAIAQQIALNGAPLIDIPTVLYDSTTSSGSSVNTGVINVSKYQSVTVYVLEAQPTGSAPAQPGVNSGLVRNVFMNFTVSAMGATPPTFRGYQADYVGGGGTGTWTSPQLIAQLPVSGDRFQVSVNGNDNGITGTVTNRVVVLGSYRSIPRAQYQVDNAYANRDSFIGGYVLSNTERVYVSSFTANQSILSLPTVVAGPGKVYLYTGVSFPSGLTFLIQALAGGSVLVSNLLATTTPGFYEFEVVFPASPVQIQLTNKAASTVTGATYVGLSFANN